jgi:hypothetical protein
LEKATVHVVVMDISGRRVVEKKSRTAPATPLEVSLSELKPGIYFVRTIVDSQEFPSQKLIKTSIR